MEFDLRRLAVSAVVVGILVASLGAEAALARKLFDKKPHDGVAAAHKMPVQGIDVSYYQGEIDWQKVRKAGVDFAYIKATEGADRFDEKFLANWRAAQQAGLPRGAYHFMYWCSLASLQATWFKSKVPKDKAALPPVLDVEWNTHSKTCPRRINRSLAIAKIKVMLEAMEAHSGKRPIIYTDPKFHREVLEGEFTDYDFWLRSVAASPEEKYETRDWAFWQFTTTGRVYGVAGPVDRNSFNGTRADWKRVLIKGCVCRATETVSAND